MPRQRWYEREKLQEIISTAYPRMKIEFSEDPRVRLVGLDAPDKSSAAAVVPKLDQLVEDFARFRKLT